MMSSIQIDFQLNCPILSLTQNAFHRLCEPTSTPKEKRKKRQEAQENPIVPMPKQVT
jgi:hypothetical protein